MRPGINDIYCSQFLAGVGPEGPIAVRSGPSAGRDAQWQDERIRDASWQADARGQPDPGPVRQHDGPSSGRNHTTSPVPTAMGMETDAKVHLRNLHALCAMFTTTSDADVCGMCGHKKHGQLQPWRLHRATS